ncbi:MAG: nuoH, partial [Acidimicrobiia bacterium]|nr:nuoH [Acidimicrobiia bacterium]
MFAAGDPLLSGGVGASVFLVVVVKVLVAFGFSLIGTMFMIWFVRKVIAKMQNRVGPNTAGPFGLLQTLADGIKLFFKEDLLPERADPFVFRLAPYLSVIPAFLTFAVVPIAGDYTKHAKHPGQISIFGHWTLLQVADPPIGILLVLAMSSLAVYGVMLAGWSSGSKYPLLGSVRASAQMISYEAALGMSVVAVVLVSKSLSTSGIVAAQDGLLKWSIITTGFVPFGIFIVAALAELNHPPFDLVEAEQELVGGFHTEYSGVRFALFYVAEFLNQITMSAIVVTLFLGGPRGFFDIPGIPNTIESVFWFFLKLFVMLFGLVWVRATVPRLRYDQLMDLGWKVMIPASFGWLLLLITLRVSDTL